MNQSVIAALFSREFHICAGEETLFSAPAKAFAFTGRFSAGIASCFRGSERFSSDTKAKRQWGLAPEVIHFRERTYAPGAA